jgi:hypothetical protein
VQLKYAHPNLISTVSAPLAHTIQIIKRLDEEKTLAVYRKASVTRQKAEYIAMNSQWYT